MNSLYGSSVQMGTLFLNNSTENYKVPGLRMVMEKIYTL
jgi:hypothetical protein